MTAKQTVDWKKFIEMENAHREGTHSQTLYEKEVTRLISIGILNLRPNSGFSLHVTGIPLNLRSYSLTELYFSDEKQATKYAEIQYGNSLYKSSIVIVKYDESGKVDNLRDLKLGN